MDRVLQQAEASFKAGDRARAEALCQQVLGRAPGNPDALRLLGVLRLEGGRAAAAIPLLRDALQADPKNLSTLDALSAAFMTVEDYPQAEEIVRRALALDAGLIVAHMRLGMALASQGKWHEAAHAFEEVTARDPQLADAHHNLGDALTKLHRVPDAIACFGRALALNPANPDSHNSLGYALQELGLWEAAMARYERALALDPSHAIAQYNLGVARLFRHEFELAWPDYERRLDCAPIRSGARKDPATVDLYERLPRWRGPGEAGVREVAIWAEQGIGDQILFSTLIPELAGAGVPFIYEVDRRLLKAYERAFPGAGFVPINDPPQEALRRASRVLLAGSLPGQFRTTRASFARQPAKTLSALPERVAHYRVRLEAPPGTRLKVALSWRSTRADWWVQKKNALLDDFAPLLNLPGVRFVDVQYGDTRAERQAVEQATGARLLHFDEVDYFNDLEEVLAILEACDLLITTSNATAHFAGALGKRTWLLYPADRPPFYYWAHDENHRSLWYPAVEILSSVQLANWRSLIHAAATRLREEASPGEKRPEGAAALPAKGTPSSGDWLERARTRRLEGRLAEAVALCRRELKQAPRNAEALNELAHALRWQGNLEEARLAATRAIEIMPQLASAWFNLGATRVEQGEVPGGIEAYRKALELEPDFAEAWSNLGDALAASGDAPGEIDAYFRAVDIKPGLAPAWSNLGTALLESGEVKEALSACRRAIALDPDHAAAWNNLGNALREHGEHGEAVRACERAIKLSPQMAQAWSNLGCALMEQGEIEKSLAAHRQALGLKPRIARAHYNLGLAYERCQQYEAAAGSYRRAVEIEPVFPAARVRLACSLLTRGNFPEGWPEYEWRWQEKGAQPKRFDFTPWAGERTPGRRLLLWGEQGLGDEILYSSMIGELADGGPQLTLEIDPRLVQLMQRSFPGVRVVARMDPAWVDPAAFDCQVPLGSLGRWLRPSFGAFPVHGGYLRTDTERAGLFAERLRRPGPDKVVGISWLSANRSIGAVKSSALADWAGLLKAPGCRFVDLQYGDTVETREALRQRHGLAITHLDEVDLLNDVEGLAALCSACDLVITVSNVTAHLAGALGKPVWLLAPRAKGRIWYWFADRNDSPWYPSMRIFEQARPGEWQPVLDAVARELAAYVRGA